MSKEEENKAVVGRWFTEFWGKNVNLKVIDEIAAPDMLLKYSLHEARRGREDIKAFMTDFRKAFPDLNFWGTADLIAEGDYVVGSGKVVAPIRVRPSMTFWSAVSRLRPAARCTSPAQRY
jgi:SnoaL-like polyketide cyclase